MDDFARQKPGDRADLFATVAARRGLNAAIVEKDFWVCWTLRRLFTLENPPAGLLFKGGTSLSKVFKVIERFSEDIDLSFNRVDLGFGGTGDPAVAHSGKQRQKSLDALTQTCRHIIRDVFLPRLRAAFRAALPEERAWKLEIADDDPDQQTIVFQYPAGLAQASAAVPAYVRPVVRMELGARSEHWPATMGEVVPYAAEDFPDLFRTRTSTVHVLAAERTYWEKATILHMWHHAPADKSLRDRQSRHYYDLVRMYQHGIGREAMKNTDLLLKVAEHKSVFFASAAARYAEARPGTLRLVPPESRFAELRRDYQSMQEMIFGEMPSFDELMKTLREIEAAINRV